jgi:hypothetical protein
LRDVDERKGKWAATRQECYHSVGRWRELFCANHVVSTKPLGCKKPCASQSKAFEDNFLQKDISLENVNFCYSHNFNFHLYFSLRPL